MLPLLCGCPELTLGTAGRSIYKSQQVGVHVGVSRRSWVIGASACGLMPFVFAQIVNLGQAVNMAGRQRMLAMRTVKAYLTLGKGVEPERSAKVLQASVADYDRVLTQLRVYSPTPEIKESYLKLSDKWRDAKDILIGLAPSKPGAKQALAGAEELVSMADLATRQLEKLSGNAATKLVNVSGRQRLLTQRIAAYYFAEDWALPNAQARAQIARAREEHETALRLLESSEINTADIKRQLLSAKNMWVFFDVAISNAALLNSSKAANDLFTASELILQGYDDLTGLYAKLG